MEVTSKDGVQPSDTLLANESPACRAEVHGGAPNRVCHYRRAISLGKQGTEQVSLEIGGFGLLLEGGIVTTCKLMHAWCWQDAASEGDVAYRISSDVGILLERGRAMTPECILQERPREEHAEG